MADQDSKRHARRRSTQLRVEVANLTLPDEVGSITRRKGCEWTPAERLIVRYWVEVYLANQLIEQATRKYFRDAGAEAGAAWAYYLEHVRKRKNKPGDGNIVSDLDNALRRWNPADPRQLTFVGYLHMSFDRFCKKRLRVPWQTRSLRDVKRITRKEGMEWKETDAVIVDVWVKLFQDKPLVDNAVKKCFEGRAVNGRAAWADWIDHKKGLSGLDTALRGWIPQRKHLLNTPRAADERIVAFASYLSERFNSYCRDWRPEPNPPESPSATDGNRDASARGEKIDAGAHPQLPSGGRPPVLIDIEDVRKKSSEPSPFDLALLNELLGYLLPDERRTLELLRLEGMTHKEAAEELQKRPVDVKLLEYRALRKLGRLAENRTLESEMAMRLAELKKAKRSVRKGKLKGKSHVR